MQRLSQRLLNLSHAPAYGLKDFFVAPANQIAFNLIQAWPQWSSHCLIIYGPKASGKTHLANIWAGRTTAKFLEMEEIETGNLDAISQQVKAIVLEDVPAKLNEQSLFHLYNVCQQSKTPLLLTAESSPKEWQLDLPDLKSRLQSCQWACIEDADDELRKAIMRKLLADAQVIVPESIITYLLNHADRSYKGLQKIIDQINSYALSAKRKITLPLIKEALD